MATRISHIPFYGRMIIPDAALFAVAFAYALPLAVLLIWKPILGIAFAVVPICILLISHGPSGVYTLVVSTFVFLPLSSTIAVLPSDIAAFILIAAYVVDLFFKGRRTGPNWLARPFLIYFAIVFLSVAASGFTALSIRFFLRQSVLVAAFLAISHFGPRMKVRNIIVLFVLTADLNSLYSIMEFLSAGGTIRAFGLAGRGYGDHVMLAFLISSVYYLWTDDLRGRIFWGISALLMAGALAATQTRASAITVGWALIIIVLMAVRYGRRIRCRIPRKSLAAAFFLLLLIFPILILYTPVFEGIMYRFGRIGLQASGTILLRMSLWKAALAAFAGHPILGIGAGNFPQVYNWVPNVRFDPIFFFVSGMSAHAVIFTALAETGLLGLLSMYYFFGRAVKIAHRNVKAAASRMDMAAAHSLFIAALAVLGSSFYAGSWFWGNNSYHMVIVFGLIASFRHQPEKLLSGGKSA